MDQEEMTTEEVGERGRRDREKREMDQEEMMIEGYLQGETMVHQGEILELLEEGDLETGMDHREGILVEMMMDRNVTKTDRQEGILEGMTTGAQGGMTTDHREGMILARGEVEEIGERGRGKMIPGLLPGETREDACPHPQDPGHRAGEKNQDQDQDHEM